VGIERTGPAGPFRFVGSQAERAYSSSPRPQEPPTREDSINLSSAARDLANADPADREALVERIRSQVQAGTYRVDAEAVAQEIVRRGDA
jgi:flagellar biosynthesis anti-sigma factor FlgM